jgi:hypothetical protein
MTMFGKRPNTDARTHFAKVHRALQRKIESENAFKLLYIYAAAMRPQEPVRQLLFATEIIALAYQHKICK